MHFPLWLRNNYLHLVMTNLREEVAFVKHILFALVGLLACSVLPAGAKTPDVSGKYYRCVSVRGVMKVYKAEYLDFHSDGRCGYRALGTDALGHQCYRTEVVSYDVVGSLIEITGEDGFVAYEIKGDRIVSEQRVYIRAAAADANNAPKKPARKPVRRLARNK